MRTDFPEFKSYPKIPQFDKQWMVITQKIHGTNAQIYIYRDLSWNNSVTDLLEVKVLAGSRTRWLTPEDDNYGFAKWVEENKEELIEIFGEGRHYGEWAGPGINNGEGLPRKFFIPFNMPKFDEEKTYTQKVWSQIGRLPLLYEGPVKQEAIVDSLELLKSKGSQLVDGFMHPEGIVVDIGGQKYKKVFTPEETAWTGNKKVKAQRASKLDVSHLLQPLRLEKLLSKDESYTRNFPESLSEVCRAYIQDLLEEGELASYEDLSSAKKELGRHVYPFVITQIKLHLPPLASL